MKSKKNKVRASYPGWYNDNLNGEMDEDSDNNMKFHSGVKVDGINHGQYLKNIQRKVDSKNLSEYSVHKFVKSAKYSKASEENLDKINPFDSNGDISESQNTNVTPKCLQER